LECSAVGLEHGRSASHKVPTLPMILPSSNEPFSFRILEHWNALLLS
jgi:hypothetical protein